MHNRGYVHADIKAANLLLDESKDDQNKQVYLVDFGLASKYSLDKEFKANPKKAHDGTIEYLSRDAHLGGNSLIYKLVSLVKFLQLINYFKLYFFQYKLEEVI